MLNIEKLWVDFPLKARVLSEAVAAILVDGIYLASFPVVAIAITPLALLGGFLVGWLHPGFATVFSESMLIMIVVGVLGVLSARLGLLFVLGFVAGDFFLASHKMFYPGHGLWRNFLEVRAPLLIEYALLAFLAVGIAMFTKSVLSSFRPPQNLTKNQVLALAFISHAAVTAVFVYFWTQAVPLLMRPVFVWPGSYLPISMAQPLQERWLILVAVLAGASIARVFLQGILAASPERSRRVDQIMAKIAKEPMESAPLTDRIPKIATVVFLAGWTVFILSGMISSFKEAGILFAIFTVFVALRKKLIPLPLGDYPRLLIKIPAVGRFLAGVVLVWFTTGRILATGGSFQTMLMTIVISLAIFLVLHPPVKEEGEA